MEGAAGFFYGDVNLGRGGRPPVDWPHRVGAVPRLAHGRQPRPADGLLTAAVTSGGTTVVCQVLAGMGGVGKTQLAANLATRLWDTSQLDLLIWVTASSRATIIDTYARAAADLTGIDDSNPQHAADRLLAWLAATGRRWLLVLDDITDPTDLTGLWPPDTATGRTVATTRRRDTALLAGRHPIDVGVFTPAEAHAYLAGQLGDTAQRLAEADRLAADLGYLPIALAQAAAYILDRDLTCADYRTRLRQRRLDRLHPNTLPDEQQRAVTETWALSIAQADTDTDRLATQVLMLAALLDANGIPANLFTTTAALIHYRHTLNRGDIDADDAADTAHALFRLGLADTVRDPDTDITLIRVHALVQRVVAEATPDDQHPRLAHTAADALLRLWPAIERDTHTARLGQLLRANTTALTATAGNHLWHTRDGQPDAHPLLFRAGRSLGEIGQVAAARDHFQQLRTEAVRVLGPDHPHTLNTRYHIAYWRGHGGDPAGAAQAFEELLADYLGVLGPDHPHTLTTRSNLARWRGEAGDPAGAAQASEDLLTDRLRVLGPDHPHTLTTRSNIAYWRGQGGDSAGAAQAYEDLLTDYLRVLGPDHPHTLITRHQLAYWRGHDGDPGGAAHALEELLADYLRVLGPDHPETLATRSNLARWRGEAGDPAGAAQAFEDLLTDRLRVLGPDHPETLSTRSNLARWRGEAGDPAGAAQASEDLLTDRLRVLGPDHPHTLITRGNVARWRGYAGDPAGATQAYEELLADRVRVLGPDHPHTLTTRHGIAYWRGDAGDPAGATQAFEELLADRVRVLGPDHPHTLSTRRNIAYWRGQAGGESTQEEP